MVRIQGKLEKIMVVRIYAPNESKTEFYQKLEEFLLDFCDQKVILLGDFNGVVSPEMDKLSNEIGGKEGRFTKTSINRIQLIEKLDLQDTWRCKHPLKKQFT